MLTAIAEERGFSNWVELFQAEHDWYGNPDVPTIFAWKAVTRGASVPVQELERNPYYWKIDTAGNQLPYVDHINRPNLGDREAILLDVIAGQTDYMNPYTLGYLTNYPVLKQNEESGGYRVLPQFGWSDVLGVVTFNMSTEDDVLRELFRNKEFRVALSIGYDRDRINEVVFNGLYKPSQVAPPDASVYNGADPGFKLHTEHDVDRANEILDGLGLTWNEDQSQRLLPDGRPFRAFGSGTYRLGTAGSHRRTDRAGLGRHWPEDNDCSVGWSSCILSVDWPATMSCRFAPSTGLARLRSSAPCAASRCQSATAGW